MNDCGQRNFFIGFDAAPISGEAMEKLKEFASVLTNDPGPLVPWSKYYVTNLHGENSRDVIDRMTRRILMRKDAGLYLFSGQRGTGKSTELKRLKFQLERDSPGSKAFIVDAMEYINETHPISINDLFLIVLLAFANELQKEGLEDAKSVGLISRLGNWLQTEVSLTSVTIGGAKIEFREQREAIVERIRQFSIEQQERFGAGCRKFVSELAEKAKTHFEKSRIVLIVDSLERLRAPAGTEMFSRVTEIFESSIDKLHIEHVDMVYAVPPYLQYLAALQHYTNFFHLCSVEVYRHPDHGPRVPNPDGIEAMIRIVEKRFPDWKEIIERTALEGLILSSGGDIRQLLRVLLLETVDALFTHPNEIPLKAASKIIEATKREASSYFREIIPNNELEILKRIGQKKSIELNHPEELTIVARFFDLRAVINYHDGGSWVDANPLLWKYL